MTDFVRDARLALRSFARSPAFTATAVATLALGIGVTTTVFSLVDPLLLRPLPLRAADRLVWIEQIQQGPSSIMMSPPEPVAEAWGRRSRSFEGLEPFDNRRAVVTGAAAAAVLPVRSVRPGFLRFLGLAPVLGRPLLPGDTAAAAPAVALLGYATWRTRFGGEASVLGRTVGIDGKPYTIVGVAPRALSRLWGGQDFWTPRRAPAPDTSSSPPVVSLIGRLRPGVDAAAAARELDGIRAQMADPVFFGERPWRTEVTPMRDRGADYETELLLLLGAVGLVLVVACANVAGLLLVRGAGRAREMAIRTSLGASRGMLVRQLLTESVLLALPAGALGCLLAAWGVVGLSHLRPDGLAVLDRATVDGRVLAFAAVVSVLTGLLFGLAPALRATQARPADTLRDGAGGARQRRRLRGGLVAFEVALSVVLLTGVGLLVHSLARLREIDPGFQPRGLALAKVTLPKERYPDAASIDAFARAVEQRTRGLPGVTDAVVTGDIPLEYGITFGGLEVEGAAAPAELSRTPLAYGRVAPGSFRVFGIPIVEGRGFLPTERGKDAHVMVVGERLARALAPHGDAVGLRLRFGPDSPWYTIVGVAKDIASNGLAGRPSNRYQIHHPFSGEQVAFDNTIWLAARTGGSDVALAAMLRDAIRSMDRQAPIRELETGEALVSGELAPTRFYATLLGGFAALALALAAVGLFGTLAQAVQRRTREIGIRMALGAAAADVRGMVVRQGMVPAAAGLVIGGASSLAATRIMRGMLYDTRPGDPATLAAVAAVVLATAFLASWLPARRATRVDPTEALRAE